MRKNLEKAFVLLAVTLVALLAKTTFEDGRNFERCLQEVCDSKDLKDVHIRLEEMKTGLESPEQIYTVNKRLALVELKLGLADQSESTLIENLELSRTLGVGFRANAMLDISWFYSQFGSHEKAQSFSQKALDLILATEVLEDSEEIQQSFERLKKIYGGTDDEAKIKTKQLAIGRQT